MDDSATPHSSDSGRLALLEVFLAGHLPDGPDDCMLFLGRINKGLKQTTAEVELLTALRDLEMLRLADNKIAVVERIGARCGMSKGWVSQRNTATRTGAARETIRSVLAEQAKAVQAYADDSRLLLISMFLTGHFPDHPTDPMAFLGLINETLRQTTAEVELLTALRDLEMLRLADNKIAVVERIGARCDMSKGRVSQRNAVSRTGVPRAVIGRILTEQAARARKYADNPRTPEVARTIALTRAATFSAASDRWMERYGVRSGVAAFIPVMFFPGIREWATAKITAITGAGAGGGAAAGTGAVVAATPVAATHGVGAVAALVNVVATATGTTATVASATVAGVGLALTAPTIAPAIADVVTPDPPPVVAETPTPATSPDLSPSPTNDGPTKAGVGPAFAATSPTPTAAGTTTAPLPKPAPATSASTTSTSAPRWSRSPRTRHTSTPTPTSSEAAPPTPTESTTPATPPAPQPALTAPPAPATSPTCTPPAGGMPIPAPEPTTNDTSPPPEPTTAPPAPEPQGEEQRQTAPEPTTCPPPVEAPAEEAPLPTTPATPPPAAEETSGAAVEGAADDMFRITTWQPPRRAAKKHIRPRREATVPYAWGYRPADVRKLLYAAN
ncbi:hypothetical protein ABT352_33035 [Streptosporangium sp. NPDC000563]|uniref:hypothetical protein n=1 Tax=Streptosporangium sp. NPDC000563 TaxID=3154366 RepID=UPI0033207EA9